MKKNSMKKLLAMVLSLAMIIGTLAVAPITAQAVDEVQKIEGTVLNLWADPEETLTQDDIDQYLAGNKTTLVGGVGVHRRSSNSTNYFLFLPSNSDCTNLKFWFNGTLTITDTNRDTVVTSGEPTDALAEINAGGVAKDYTFIYNGTSYGVKCMKSGEVGSIYIDTNSGSINGINSSSDHSYGEGGTIMVVAPDGTIEYDGALDKMQGRGNATWSTTGEKNPYNIKLNVSTSLLGMGKAKKWVLLANDKDPYLIKNQLTYDFADYIGIKYQPHCKPVDVYCNQMYLGSYMLSEKVEIKSTRIDVNDAYENLEIANGTVDPTTGFITPIDFGLFPPSTNTYTSTGAVASGSDTTKCATVGNRKYSTGINNPTDITGGYLYELEISERWINENAGFCGYNRQGWVIKSCDFVTKDMADYSYNLLYALGGAIYNNGIVPSTSKDTTSGALTAYGAGTTITNPAPAAEYQGKKWSDILDADSAVKFYWTQEYFKNMDASTSSTYFFKDSDSIDGKLYAGPLWDMDHSIDKRIIDASTVGSSRWGANWRSSSGWYAREVRFYKWNGSNGLTTASSDRQSPRSFYGALYYNNADFQQLVNEYWYNTILPASKILLGQDTDPSGKLKSVDEYIDGVRYTGIMNNYRFDLTSSNTYDLDFNASEMKSEIKTWLSDRNTYINGQIKQVNISSATISNIGDQACTGSAVEPAVTITYNGKELKKGTDYKITYSNNVNVTNQATATIEGIGYYTGTVTKTFAITAGTPGEARIYESAYVGDTLTVNTKTTTGEDITNGLTYQWNANGVAIDGATDSTYTIAQSDAGKMITVSATGDGVNIVGSVVSNECAVATVDRPIGFTKTITAWDYDYTADAAALTTADETGMDFYYTATSGEQTDGAQLYGSVDAEYTEKMKWSGSDLYANDEGMINPDQAPIMGTSKTDYIAWGQWPYFETVVSTEGYQSITYSAKLGGTKKAPKVWKLQYSLDGVSYNDIANSEYSITQNKTMELAFDNVALPEECNNKSKLYIRAVACQDVSIGGTIILGQYSGDAAINNIKVKGESIAVVTHLDAPTIATDSAISSDIAFSTSNVEITDNNGGAPLYYTVNGGDATEYTGKFNPFDKTTAKAGDTMIVTAWADVAGVQSEATEFTVTFGGVDINDFNYITYSQNVSNGAVYSTGGAYGESGKMTAYTDGTSQYVPQWRDSNGAFCVAPDDGARWTQESGFYFEVATAGYEDIRFSANMYTTNQGPNSVALQYSTDGSEWNDVADSTFVLPANGELESAYVTAAIPNIDNLAKAYIRVVSKENSTKAGTKLHNNASKGNMYINNVVISGEDNGDYKMPYTNKTTPYFGSSPIKFKSPDGIDMQYAVLDPSGKLILSGTYQKKDIVDEAGNVIKEAGIDITSAPDFYNKDAGAYTISIWAGDDDDQSIVNTGKYYYKGKTVTKFSYTSTKRPITNYYADIEGTVATNTSGANAGTIAMYPNGTDATYLSYSDAYGVKVAWADTNPFVATKNLDVPAGNGYWLIKTSTKGFKSLTLNAEQISSNKGPRDWGIAYSLDGTRYTYLAKSNVRAISNDASTAPVETYNNIALPSALDDQDEVYIKIFINGGESVDGTELETLLKGNTGINNIEISGVALPGDVDYTFTTYAYEDVDMLVAGTTPVPAYVTVNGEQYFAENGSVTVQLTEGTTYTVTASANAVGTYPTITTGTVRENGTKKLNIMALDVVGDGHINAKDYAMISKDAKYASSKEYMKSIFDPFLNMAE